MAKLFGQRSGTSLAGQTDKHNFKSVAFSAHSDVLTLGTSPATCVILILGLSVDMV